MNDQELERKLRALTGALKRPDPTPAWKADILARARREASAIPMPRALPPRWLMTGWAAAWIAIAAMNFLSPEENVSSDWAIHPKYPPSSTPEPAELGALVAFNQLQKLNLELP